MFLLLLKTKIDCFFRKLQWDFEVIVLKNNSTTAVKKCYSKMHSVSSGTNLVYSNKEVLCNKSSLLTWEVVFVNIAIFSKGDYN